MFRHAALACRQHLQIRMHQWLQAWTLWPAARESLSILLSKLISLSFLPCPSTIAQSPVDSFRLFPTDYIKYPVPYSNNQSNRQIPPRVNPRLLPDPHVAAQSSARGKGGPIPGKQPSNPDTGPAAGPRNRDQGPCCCCPARDGPAAAGVARSCTGHSPDNPCEWRRS